MGLENFLTVFSLIFYSPFSLLELWEDFFTQILFCMSFELFVISLAQVVQKKCRAAKNNYFLYRPIFHEVYISLVLGFGLYSRSKICRNAYFHIHCVNCY